MRFIDYMRLNPMCFDGDTDRVDFDASELIDGTTVFDVSEVADQLIESATNATDGTMRTKFTPRGLELVKMRPTADGYELDLDRYVGIIPPFDNCFLEYPTTAYDRRPLGAVDCGIHLQSMPKEWIAQTFPDEGFAFVLFATVFFRIIVDGASMTGRETVAIIASDSEGRLLNLKLQACVPREVDRSQPKNFAQQTPIVVMLVSLMMLSCRLVKATLSSEVVKTRQQRRFEKRNPSRTTPPMARYYVLSIDPERTQGNSTAKGGGWEMAWHTVRGFLRHLKSGKVVPVRPHSRGNPFKGVILKDYKVKGPSGTP